MKKLTNKQHWQGLYQQRTHGRQRPLLSDYHNRLLARFFAEVFAQKKIHSVLEIGCGDSVWLPYLAGQYNCKVTGMDYSPQGCLLARQRLKAAKIPGKIICADMFNPHAALSGTFDMVYSLGVVEHFTDIFKVIEAQKKFLKKGGILCVEIPNMTGFHGLLSWLYQPAVYAQHNPLCLLDLQKIFKQSKVQELFSGHYGAFSFNIVSWGVSPRLPLIDPLVYFAARVCSKITNSLLCVLGRPGKSRSTYFSPFIMIAGVK